VSPVVIAGGGTGGHLFPGLAVARELAGAGVRVAWLGSRRGLEATRVAQEGLPLRLLSVTGAAARAPAAQAAAVLRAVPATLQAAAHLLACNARAVLAVGGYASVPGALAAGMLGIPLVLQEQNAVPGVANRFLAPWCSVIACGFEAALPAFPSLPARWTGNPVRAEFFGVPEPPFQPITVLVIGGSQGSAFLNAVVPPAFAATGAPDDALTIVHQAGAAHVDEVRARYAALGRDAEVVAFLERPAEAMARAALVVSRAGALTVCELAAAKRAAILVPFAAAAGGHQAANARAYAATGAAEVLEEGEANPKRLAALLGRLLASPRELIARGRAGVRIAPPAAAGTVARIVLEAAAAAGGGH
jgi:UDP-N-acetylglucosamine--N-acetylmuramyl-(pentapeptide) pyrophosphoryl-undecaprenol N-acetylglucosamine transferase